MTPSSSRDNHSAKYLLDRVATRDEIQMIARDICVALNQEPRFCLWLCGSVGAGKTTIASAILHALGLPENVPVLSPTYTYLQEYQLPDGRRIAHMDLYRGTAIDALEDSGIFADLEQYQGVLIEWPPIGDSAQHATEHGYSPTQILNITPLDDGASRLYQLSVAR